MPKSTNNMTNSMINRFGGKYYARKVILPNFPKQINEYCEPFMGSGVIFFNLRNAGISVKTSCYLNDINDSIFAVWQCFYEPELFEKLISKLENFAIYSERAFYYLKEKKPSDIVEKAFILMMLNMSSYNGRNKDYYVGINDVNRRNAKIYKLKDYWTKFHDYIREMNVKISNRDYRQFLTGYFNRKTNFAFLDPPYFGTKGYGKDDFTKEDHIELYQILREFEGRFALTLNNREWVRETYSDYNIIPIQTRYCANSKSDYNKKGVKDLLILNYDPEEVGASTIQKEVKNVKLTSFMEV